MLLPLSPLRYSVLTTSIVHFGRKHGEPATRNHVQAPELLDNMDERQGGVGSHSNHCVQIRRDFHVVVPSVCLLASSIQRNSSLSRRSVFFSCIIAKTLRRPTPVRLSQIHCPPLQDEQVQIHQTPTPFRDTDHTLHDRNCVSLHLKRRMRCASNNPIITALTVVSLCCARSCSVAHIVRTCPIQVIPKK